MGVGEKLKPDSDPVSKLQLKSAMPPKTTQIYPNLFNSEIDQILRDGSTGWSRSNTWSLKLNKKGKNSQYEKNRFMKFQVTGIYFGKIMQKNYQPYTCLSIYMFVCMCFSVSLGK